MSILTKLKASVGRPFERSHNTHAIVSVTAMFTLARVYAILRKAGNIHAVTSVRSMFDYTQYFEMLITFTQIGRSKQYSRLIIMQYLNI